MQQKHNFQHVILFHHFRRILERALDDKIEIAPLKGAHLVTSVYLDAAERGFMGDVDFLVPINKWDRVVSMMFKLGFTLETNSSSHELGFNFDIDGGQHILIEPHCYIFDPERFYIDHDELWQRAYKSEFDGVECFRLSDEDHFCHLAFHSMLHRLTSFKRTCEDLKNIIKSREPEFIKKIIVRARQWNTTRVIWFFVKQISKDLQEYDLDETLKALQPNDITKNMIDLVFIAQRQSFFSSLHHRAQAAVIWAIMFDSPSLLAKMVLNHPSLQKNRVLSKFL